MRCRSPSFACLGKGSVVFIKFLPARVAQCRLYDDVLGRLPARFKMSVVKKFIRVPRQVSQTVERMLALRDVFAHVCTLDYNRQRNLEYKGPNILSETGFAAYVHDSRDATAFLIEHSRVLKPPTKRSSPSGSVSGPREG